MSIHPTAVIDPEATLGAGVEVGPYSVIGAGVVVGDGCRIGPHACLVGPMVLGEGNVVGPGAVIGLDPQVKGNDGPFGATRIGARNVLREHTTVHRSMYEDKETVIGDDNLFMVGSHVAHDCVVGNDVTLCNCVALGGHVVVGDRAYVGGDAFIGQFRRIGELAVVAGKMHGDGDVPPFCMAVGGRPARLTGLNVVGLRRAGYGPEARQALKDAYHTLFRTDRPHEECLDAVALTTPEVERLVAFLRAPTKYGVAQHRRRANA